MTKGRLWPPECKDYEDPRSGAHVRQLTNYMGHSHHPYFTNPGWYAGGRKLLFGSDRENRTNLFGLHLRTGEITQLTDLEYVPPPHETNFQRVSVNPVRDEAYFWYELKMFALDLQTLEMRPLWQMPKGFLEGNLSCTADGKYVCTSIFEDLSEQIRIDYNRGYVGFKETFEARPLSRIVRIATDGSGTETIWEEHSWIGHVNTSPTQAHLLTFCHEGPWNRVDNRIWGLDLMTANGWMIRPREAGESVGHEYWLDDGVHIGYHGVLADGRKILGKVKYDNTDRVEVDFPYVTGHTHSNDFDMIAGDGGIQVRLWRWNKRNFDGPRCLCEHRSSQHIQKLHVHPRFTPDGKRVLFTSSRSGYGNVYLADVPDFDSLPTIEED